MHILLGFQRLVQAVGVATTGHDAAGELIDDEHLPVFDQVVDIQPENQVGFQRLVNLMKQIHILQVIEVVQVEETFGFLDAFFTEHHRLRFLIMDIAFVLRLMRTTNSLTR